jgi:hypothetical protein
VKFDIPDLKRHELTASRESFISDTQDRAFAIRAQAFAGALDKFLDIFPTQRVRLVLAR